MSTNDFDIGVAAVHIFVDSRLTEQDTPATSLKNISFKYFNGSDVPYVQDIFVHEHTIKRNGEVTSEDKFEIGLKNVNTTLNEDINVTITFTKFEERGTNALESLVDKIVQWLGWLVPL